MKVNIMKELKMSEIQRIKKEDGICFIFFRDRMTNMNHKEHISTIQYNIVRKALGNRESK